MSETENKVNENAAAEEAEKTPVTENTAESAAEEPAEKTNDEAPAAENKENEQISKLQEELAAAKDQNVRLLADFDNFRRRVTRERNETYQRATESAISEFLPVMDNFDRAISQAPAAGDAFADGIRMVYEQLSSVLSKAGVTPIEAIGIQFNPNDHEAIAYQPSPDAPEGQIIYEAKRGYRMGDKVIRPASVIVSSGAPAAAAPAATATEEEKPQENA